MQRLNQVSSELLFASIDEVKVLMLCRRSHGGKSTMRGFPEPSVPDRRPHARPRLRSAIDRSMPSERRRHRAQRFGPNYASADGQQLLQKPHPEQRSAHLRSNFVHIGSHQRFRTRQCQLLLVAQLLAGHSSHGSHRSEDWCQW